MMKSPKEIERQLDAANCLAVQSHHAVLFIQGRLLLDFVWLILIFYSSPDLASLSAMGIVLALPLVDLSLLAVYYMALRRWREFAPRVTQISAVATAVGIAATAHLLGDFTWSGFTLYFLLVVAAAIASPWNIAGISSAAYLALVGVEMIFGGAASGKSTANLQDLYPLPIFAVIGIWLVAFVMNQVIAAGQRALGEQGRLVEETRRRLEAEAVWSTVGKTVTATQDLDEVLTDVIRVLNEKLQVEAGSVLLRERETDELYFAKTLHGNVEQFAAIRIQIGQGIAGWVAQTGQATVVPDTTQDPRWFGGVDDQTGFVTRSVICVPLIAKGELVGIIEVLNKKNGSFNEEDLQLLQSIASPVAIAIQNARLHRLVQSQLGELTALFRQVEHAKREWEETVDAIDEGITLVDDHSKILRANSTLAHWLDTTPSAMVGRMCYQVIHGLDAPPDYCPHSRTLNSTDQVSSAEFEEPRLKKTFLCTRYPFHDPTGRFVGTVNVLKDITAQKRMQAQLIQSERLAAIGQLATSLAHEINNPLQGIKGCLDLIRADLQDNARSLQFLEMIQDEINRLAVIVQRMLDFYRPALEKPTSVDLRAAVDTVLAFSAKRLQHARVGVRLEWADDLPVIKGIDNQLKQVFLNLVLNAIESMPEGGELRVQGCGVEDQGRWVVVHFTDSGSGIPPEMLERIFDPFFTTKTEGTGLGLAVCHTLVSSHGGRLTVESHLGHGSTFSVRLPAE